MVSICIPIYGVEKYIETVMDEGALKKRTEAYLLYQ